MHSGLLSFSWYAAGHQLVMDPGTLCYAGSIEDRNQLRAAAAHSTAHPEDEEVRELIGGFQTGPARRARVEWVENVLCGAVRLDFGFEFARHIRFDDALTLSIEDQLVHEKNRRIEGALILASGEIEVLEKTLTALHVTHETQAGDLVLRSEASGEVEWAIDSLTGSLAYGVACEFRRIRALGFASQGLTIESEMTFIPRA